MIHKGLTDCFFSDKRDKKYQELLSENSYFEIFTTKERKCQINIPETIIFNESKTDNSY